MINKLLYSTLTFLLVLACAPLTLHSAANSSFGISSLQLNGIAIQSELRSDWFINALYLTTKSKDSEAILSDLSPKRMEIKVLAENLSGRRLKRFWVERIRNNNAAGEVLAQAKQVRNFAAAMGHDLKVNDVIAIDFVPAQATRVSINGSVISELAPALFNLVLKSWLGERPPSQEFKDSILGVNNYDNLLTRYQSIQPSEDRVAFFDKQLQKEIAKKEQAEKEKKLAEERKIAAAKAEEQDRLRKLAEAQEQERQTQLAAQAQAQEAERLRIERERQAKEVEQAQAEKPPVVEIPAGPSPEEIAQLKSDYRRSIVRHYTSYFEYPARELIKRYGTSVFARPRKGKTHGTVNIQIEIDRDGELVSGGVVKTSGEKILDESVQKALFDAVPFPAMPTELTDETFSTVLPIEIPAPSF